MTSRAGRPTIAAAPPTRPASRPPGVSVPFLESLGLRYDGDAGTLHVLDQTRLPHEERWLDGSDPADMVGHIQRLSVRGAPMIGVCAALSLACASRRCTRSQLLAHAAALRAARPTAVNLMWAVDRLVAAIKADEDIPAAAEQIFAEDVARCAAMARHGAPLIAAGTRALTHCNTGGLATAGDGTALAVIRRAHAEGRLAHVWVDETRPLLQGARLTTWELARAGIPHTLITDSAAAMLMAAGRVDAVLVGADRIAANGDFANKIGTLALALLAHHHALPFYVVAPRSTVDPACPGGHAIPIEERDPDEVRGGPGAPPWAPTDVPVCNPAFDVTPAALVTAWVLDTGVLRREEVDAGALRS
ncbi:MAG: S-methyl-5-thioribose-1-phosphate isomerase [Deltaproteobacteria bacterium]|nr:MAG: S-methyl-5-thioribose-1-phosphate isomerase [Deltaproteobacteria bacterium]